MEQYKQKLEEFENFLRDNCNDIPVQSLNKLFLTRCLHVCKYDTDKAAELIRRGMKFRTQYAREFKDREYSDEDMITARNCLKSFFLPQLSEDGSSYSFHVVDDSDVKSFEICNILKELAMTLDIYQGISVHSEIPNQCIAFIDAGKVGFRHFLKIIPSLVTLKIYSQYLEEVLSYKVVEIHIFNSISIAGKIYLLFKPFLKNFIQFKFHSNVEGIYDFINRDILPNEYGGNAESYITIYNDYRKKIEKNLSVLKEFGNLILPNP